MWLLLTALVAFGSEGSRVYVGPQDVVAPPEFSTPQPARPPPPPSLAPVDFSRREGPPEPRSGRGLLIAGGVFAGMGALASVVAVGAAISCANDCGEPYLELTAGWTASSLFLPTPLFIGIGSQLHRYERIHVEVVHERRKARPGRRAMIAPGIVLCAAGLGALAFSYPVAFGVAGSALRLGGAALTIGGAAWAGDAHGRWRATRGPARVHAMPLVFRGTVGVALGGEF